MFFVVIIFDFWVLLWFEFGIGMEVLWWFWVGMRLSGGVVLEGDCCCGFGYFLVRFEIRLMEGSV